MEAFAGYLYYRDNYGGQLTEKRFQALLHRASIYVNALTGGKAAYHSELDSVKMAVCAVVDAMHRQDDGGVLASESVGSWSRTFANGKVKSAEQLIYDAAMLYLADSGLVSRWC